MTNYYFILGVKDFASLEEIKTAYRKLAKNLHPDHNSGDPFFDEQFKKIQSAYECLSNYQSKAKHDVAIKIFNEQNKANYTNSYQEKQQSKEEPKAKDYTNDAPKPNKKTKVSYSRKWHFLFLLIIPVFLIVYQSFDNTVSKTDKPIQSEKYYAKYILEGNAINTTLKTSLTSEAVFTLFEYENNIFKCQGRFDEKNLFGRFEVTGRDINEVSNPNSLNLSLKGEIVFGENDGSGFNQGSKVGFKVYLNLNSFKAVGSYVIDSIPNSSFSHLQQRGLLDLTLKKKILDN